MTILFGTVTVLMAALREFHLPEVIVVALLSGLAADILVLALRPRRDRPVAFRLFATIVPLVLWTLYFVATHLRWGLALSPELWVGGVFFTGAFGLALSLIMVPAAEPVKQ